MPAVLALCPSWGPSGEAALVQSSRHEARLAALGDLLGPWGGHVGGSDGELVLAVMPAALDALWAAFDLGGVVGLGFDAGEPLLATAEAGRVRRLAWRAPPGVRCTAAFRAALGTVPVGVGLFRVPHDLEHRLGFDAWELSDGRQ